MTKAQIHAKYGRRLYALTHMEVEEIIERGDAAEKEKQIEELHADMAEKVRQIEALTADVSGKIVQIDTLNNDVVDRDKIIQGMSADLAEQSKQIDTLNADVAAKAAEIDSLNADIADKAEQIGTLEADVAGKAEQIGTLEADVAGKAEQIGTLEADVADKAGQIDTLSADLTDRDQQIEQLTIELSKIIVTEGKEMAEIIDGTWEVVSMKTVDLDYAERIGKIREKDGSVRMDFRDGTVTLKIEYLGYSESEELGSYSAEENSVFIGDTRLNVKIENEFLTLYEENNSIVLKRP